VPRPGFIGVRKVPAGGHTINGGRRLGGDGSRCETAVSGKGKGGVALAVTARIGWGVEVSGRNRKGRRRSGGGGDRVRCGDAMEKMNRSGGPLDRGERGR
jgi:hypothetical protein